MTYKTTKYVLLLASALFFNTTWADDGSLSMLVHNCMSCHGPNGASLGPATPTLANMNPSTFIKAMEEFKDNERPSTVMEYIAKGYTDEDYQVMANYFAKQQSIAPQQSVDADKVKRGAKLHQKYCKKCHDEGVYTTQPSTLIVGQWIPYLRLTLDDFHTGIRELPKRVLKVMQTMVEIEGEKSLDDLVHFYASQAEQK
jgi:sulfide dehydrogenase cytochrome subunit